MIQSIHIKNFQSHQDTRLTFHPGLNAILGVSDSGKSSILRALHWVRENRPMGDAHISKWAKSDKGKLIGECSVLVQAQGGPVSRIRAPEFNGYKVGELSFEAVRSDVPAEVNDAFNMGEVNVQKQLDAPFLLSKGPAEVSRFFNSVVNLEEMGQLMCAAERDRLDLKKESTKAEKDIKALDVKIDALAWIDQVKLLVSEAGKIQSTLDVLTKKASLLSELYNKAQTAKATIAIHKATVDLELLVSEGLMLSSSLAVREKTGQRLATLKFSMNQATDQSIACFGIVSLGEQVESTKVISSKLSALEASKRSLAMLSSKIVTLQALIFSVQSLSVLGDIEAKAKELKSRIEALNATKASLQALKSKLQVFAGIVARKESEIRELEANAPKTCPTCGSIVKHQH